MDHRSAPRIDLFVECKMDGCLKSQFIVHVKVHQKARNLSQLLPFRASSLKMFYVLWGLKSHNNNKIPILL